MNIYIYIYTMYICMCVCARERERQIDMRFVNLIRYGPGFRIKRLRVTATPIFGCQ